MHSKIEGKKTDASLEPTRYTKPCDALAITSMRSCGVVGVVNNI